MTISRYIKFPLVFGLLMSINSILIGFSLNPKQMLFSFVLGAMAGIGMQVYSDYKTLKVKPNAVEEDFGPRQTQIVPLFCSYQDAFNLCLESVTYLNKGIVQIVDKDNGLIKAKTRINWKSFGNIIEFKLKPISERVTEIEVSSQPRLQTALIDGGESLEVVRTIREFLERKTNVFSYRILDERLEIPIDHFSQHSESAVNRQAFVQKPKE